MNYKLAIDPGHGGSDNGYTGNGIIEKDINLMISNYIKERLDTLGIPTIITRNSDRNVSDQERQSIIESAYGNDKNVIVLSNHLNKGGESGVEIIYSLRNNDKLSSEISEQLTLAGYPVNKYYQLRDPSNTASDYYPIIRDLKNYIPVQINYAYVDNQNDANKIKNNYKDYAEAVVRAVAIFTNSNYIPITEDFYVVKKGDTLYKIANDFGTTVDELKKKNNLTSNLLNIGQILTIPGFSKSDNTYTVKKGDTLYQIANKYGITVDELKKANNLTSNLLNIGQVLIIPVANNQTKYIVKKGDTLYKISIQYGTTVDDIKRINKLTNNNLSIGQELLIP